MAKAPTLTDIDNVSQSATPLNSNWDAIQASFENTVSLDGSTPNAMLGDFDLNSNDILNGGTVSTSLLNTTALFVNGVQVTTTVSTIATASSLGEEVYLLDRMTETQAAAALAHTLTDDMSPLINAIIGEAGVTRLVINGLIPISSPIDITEAKLNGKGFHIHTNTQGRARDVGGIGATVIQKKSDWVGGYALDVNSVGTSAIKTVHLTGFVVDGNGQSGGICKIQYAQDIHCNFSGINSLGYGMVLNGVWNSDFAYMHFKECQAGGIIFRPIIRENSNLSFTNQPWVAACGGDGEIVFEDNATYTNATIRFDNLLCEGPVPSGGSASNALIVIENGKRIQFDIPQITSEDGRDSNCVKVGLTGRVGDLEDIVFSSPNFNNTGTKTEHHCLRMVGVPAETITILTPGKKGNNRFFKSDATTSDAACWLVAKSSVIAGSTDLGDLDDVAHVTVWDNSINVGNKGSAASDAQLVGTVAGKNLEIGATSAGGVSTTFVIDPDAIEIDFSTYALVTGGNVTSTGKVTGATLNVSSIPTSAAGLNSGDVWSNSGVLTIVS